MKGIISQILFLLLFILIVVGISLLFLRPWEQYYAAAVDCCQKEGTDCYQQTTIQKGYWMPRCPSGMVFKHGELWPVDEFLDEGGK